MADPSRPPCAHCGAPAGAVYFDVVGRLARLVTYLVSKGRRWSLDEETRGQFTVSFDGERVRAWRQMNEDPEAEWPH